MRPISICMERMKGIEPSYQAWEVIPTILSYTIQLISLSIFNQLSKKTFSFKCIALIFLVYIYTFDSQ